MRAVPRSTLPASPASKSPPVRMSPLAAMQVPLWGALQGSAYRELKEQLDLPFRAANHISHQKVNCGQNWPFSERQLRGRAGFALYKRQCSGTTRRWRDSSRTAIPWHALALAFAGSSCRVVCSRCTRPRSAPCRASNLVRIAAFRDRVKTRVCGYFRVETVCGLGIMILGR